MTTNVVSGEDACISGMDLSVVVVLPSLLSNSLILVVPTSIFRKI